jgi:hypothetical protein
MRRIETAYVFGLRQPIKILAGKVGCLLQLLSLALASWLLFPARVSRTGKTRDAVSVNVAPFVLPMEGLKLCLVF